jgi:beta-glucosidase
MVFPTGFVWGAAAASYQVEGAAYKDGKGLSVWDMMCRKEGAIWNRHSGDVACDHYHRFREDVALMQSLNLQAYRLSISWPRVLPDGVGAVNPKGLAFYDQLVDELLRANIQPYITLFHWDYPYALYRRGGWLNSDSPEWFAEYTHVIVDKLSDRVRHWMTLNEPQCFIGLGHKDGVHAPGDKLGWREVLLAAHHSLLAHGKSVQVIRAQAKTPSLIGFAPVGSTCVPATDSPADIAAARMAMFSTTSRTLWSNTWFSDPIFKKQYPSDALTVFGEDAPVVGPQDMEIIGQPLDFYGCNIYSAAIIRAGADGTPETVTPRVGHEINTYGWYVIPECLYWGPRFFYERYQQPIIITENGMSNLDWVARDGKVHDPQRIDYLARHLLAFERAGADGVDIRGYFQWSIMDNFEWQEGYKQRFGLVYVDYATQQRTPKASAYWYRDVIVSNGASLHM